MRHLWSTLSWKATSPVRRGLPSAMPCKMTRCLRQCLAQPSPEKTHHLKTTETSIVALAWPCPVAACEQQDGSIGAVEPPAFGTGWSCHGRRITAAKTSSTKDRIVWRETPCKTGNIAERRWSFVDRQGREKLDGGGADAWNHAPRVRTRRVGGNTEFDLGQGTQARIGIPALQGPALTCLENTRNEPTFSRRGPRQRVD